MRDNQKYQWLSKCMDQMDASDVAWTIPAMKLIKDILSLYPENHTHHSHSTHTMIKSSQYQNANSTQGLIVIHRASIINKMQQERSLIIKVCDTLSSYMNKVRNHIKDG